jgi:hypothetical protein
MGTPWFWESKTLYWPTKSFFSRFKNYGRFVGHAPLQTATGGRAWDGVLKGWDAMTTPERVLDQAEAVIRLVRQHAQNPVPGFDPTKALRHVAESLYRIDGFTYPMHDLLGQQVESDRQTTG